MIDSIIFDALPASVVIGGIEYPINAGYRALMAIEIEMFSDKNDEQKLLNALNIFYFQNIPEKTEEAIEKLLWFYRCGEEKRPGTSGTRSSRRGYCFKQDGPLIYAAFRQQYGINLRTTKNAELHWWEFSAMFEALDDDTKIAKVIYWRTCDLGGLSKERMKFIKKMRSLYALKDSDGDMDSRTKLTKRNANMKEYARKRMEECRKE